MEVRLIKIYLSGGMYSGWQDKLPSIEGVEFFDPRVLPQQNLNVSANYFVNEDVKGVRESDLVFCYIEESNPMPLGAAWECAVAAENNIPIITVWEKGYVDPFFSVYSLYLYTNFEDGIKRLTKYIERVMK